MLSVLEANTRNWSRDDNDHRWRMTGLNLPDDVIPPIPGMSILKRSKEGSQRNHAFFYICSDRRRTGVTTESISSLCDAIRMFLQSRKLGVEVEPSNDPHSIITCRNISTRISYAINIHWSAIGIASICSTTAIQ